MAGHREDPEECTRAMGFRHEGYHECVLLDEPPVVEAISPRAPRKIGVRVPHYYPFPEFYMIAGKATDSCEYFHDRTLENFSNAQVCHLLTASKSFQHVVLGNFPSSLLSKPFRSQELFRCSGFLFPDSEF